MHLLAPILGQLLTLGLSDRTEARYVADEDDEHFEASTQPAAGIDLSYRRTSLRIGYAPVITVLPLEREPREVFSFHTGFIGASHSFRHTTFGISQAVGYGEANFESQALAPPATTPTTGSPNPPVDSPQPNAPNAPPAQPAPGGGETPGGPGAEPGASSGTVRATDQLVKYVSLRTSAEISHRLGRFTSIQGGLGYTVTGGADEESRSLYPTVRGPDARATLSYALNARNLLSSTLSAQYATSGDSTETLSLAFDQIWHHDFSPRTAGELGAGLTYAHSPQENGSIAHSFYPAGRASITHNQRFARGVLNMNASAGGAPVLDFTTAAIDPRLFVAAGLGWGRDRFSVSVGGGTSVSLSGSDEQDAFSALNASAGVGYYLGVGFSADGGVRGAWQQVGGEDRIPPTAAAYLALSWHIGIPLNYRRALMY
jgi:hypothetical protein